MINNRRTSFYIFICVIIMFIFTSVLWLESRIQSKGGILRNNNSTISTKVTDPLKMIECDYEPQVRYWYDKNLTPENNYNKRKENFYITCKQIGSGHFLTAYIFRDYKLIFSQEFYRGRFFKGLGNDFYAISGIMNPEDNTHPFGYALIKYGYNAQTNLIELIETKEYPSVKEIQDLYYFEKNNNLDFDNDLDGADFYEEAINLNNES